MRAVLQPTRRLGVALLLAFTTLAACERVTAPDPASEPGAPALNVASPGPGSAHTVPFVFRGTVAITADPRRIPCGGLPGASVLAEYAGTGNGTHIGKSSFTLTYDTCLLGQPLGGPIAFIAEGHLTLTAANGDLLHGNVTITQFANGDAVLDSFVFTGGTGRFANAAGELSGTGHVDPTILEGEFELEGCITRPNA